MAAERGQLIVGPQLEILSIQSNACGLEIVGGERVALGRHRELDRALVGPAGVDREKRHPAG